MQRYHMAQNRFGNYFMCGPNGADGNNSSRFVLESDAQALIAAKDAEIAELKRELCIARKALKRLETNLNHAQPHPDVVITNMHAVVVEALKSMRKAGRKK